MLRAEEEKIAFRYRELAPHFPQWEKIKDVIDQFIDLILNYRQSGHPGGSRSKVHALVTLLLSGAMRWDIRNPEKRFGDRFILVAGHNIPLVYCTLALFNEALRCKYEQTHDERYRPAPPERAVFWEDLLTFRRHGGLSGHAEMEGKTLFLKFNTGPSGHGSPAAVGEALALKRAGANDVKVFAMEGEGGLTPGANHEAMNSAWGLALDNLYFLIDWNDYGIDEHPVSSAVYGGPTEWFGSHGWRTFGADLGNDWGPVLQAILQMTMSENPNHSPSVAWFKTRKGRAYNKCDYPSHGSPHKINSPEFWGTKECFMDDYGVRFEGFGRPAPQDAQALREQFRANLQVVVDALRRDQDLVDYLADTLVQLGDSVPEELPTFKLARRGNPFKDERLYDYRNYPKEMFAAPNTSAPNRQGLARWGAWVNAFGHEHYGRPIFLACSADLAESTNIIGFGQRWGDFPGYGWYERYGTPEGVMLPQEITEFANAGILLGTAAVNFAANPEEEFDGFYGAASTYGSFAYLMYGPMRLFSQMAQDCQLKLGKFICVAGHSGPETAEDSRTHFGIFAPGVTQLFPQGQIVNLYPWEHNEVPVLLGAALKLDANLIALHLTRPAIQIPDREALGMPSHFEAARGAYVTRDYRAGLPRMGTLIVQGTSAMASICKILPELDGRGLNVKVVTVTSPQLFALQPEEYRQQVLSPADKADSTAITTQGRWLMHDWIFNPLAEQYALSSDWDNRWRTGGSLDEVIEEAHLSPGWVLKGIERFAGEREQRLSTLRRMVEAAEKD